MRKINPKYLLVSFLALLAIWIIVRYAAVLRRTSNVRSEIIALDTAQIDALRISRQDGNKAILLRRLDVGKWKVGYENEPSYEADQSSVKQALGLLSKLNAQRMLTRNKEKWSVYEVTDSALLVEARVKDKTMVALRIGKVSFPATGSAFTAVRLANENEVYAVEGYLNTTLGRNLNEWRDKTFMRLKPDRVDKVVFEYPADSSFTLIKADTVWKLGEVVVKSDMVERYLGQFRNKNLSSFANDFIASDKPLFSIRFEGNGAELEKVAIWQLTDGSYVLRGVHLPVFFSDKGSTIIRDLVKSRDYFTGR